MTSATSSGNAPRRPFRPALGFFAFSLRKNVLITAIAAVLALLISPGIPLLTYSTALAYNRGMGNALFAFTDISGLVPMLMLLLALLCCLVCLVLSCLSYRYMHGRAASDVFHALPVTRTKMLLGRFFSVFLMTLVPVLVSMAGLAVVLAVTPLYGISPALFGKMFFSLVVLDFACCTFMALLAVSTGSGFDMLSSLLVTNVGWPVICLLFSGLCESKLAGYPNMGAIMQSEFVCLLSPFGRLLTLGFWDGTGEDEWFSTPLTFGKFAAFWLILGLLFLAAALLLYKWRKSEAAGLPYAYAYLPITLQSAAAVIGGAVLGMLFSSGNVDALSFYVFMALGAALGALIAGAVFARGFGKIKRDLLTAGCVFLVMLAVTGVVSSGGLGYETRVPAAGSIRSAELEFHFVTNSADYFATDALLAEEPVPAFAFLMPGGGEVRLEDPADTAAVRSLHTAIVQQIRTSSSDWREIGVIGYDEERENDAVLSFTLTYHTRVGGRVTRQYQIAAEAFTEELTPIFTSAAYLRSAYPALYDEKGLSGYSLLTCEAPDGSLVTDTLPADTMEGLGEAYRQDLEAAGETGGLIREPVYTLTLRTASMRDADTVYLPVYQGYNHTQDFLSQTGLLDEMKGTQDYPADRQEPVIYIPAASYPLLEDYEGSSNAALLTYLYSRQVPVGYTEDDALAESLLEDAVWYGSLDEMTATAADGAVALLFTGGAYDHVLTPAADFPDGLAAAPLTEEEFQYAQYYLSDHTQTM